MENWSTTEGVTSGTTSTSPGTGQTPTGTTTIGTHSTGKLNFLINKKKLLCMEGFNII